MFRTGVGLFLAAAVFAAGAGMAAGGPSAGAAGGSPASGDVQAPCDAKKLVGLWSGSRYSMEVLDDMTYRASGTPNMASIDVVGTIRVNKCAAEFVDTTGRYACPSAEVGKYTFTVGDTTLAFTLVGDGCDGRRIPLTRGPLRKAARQAPHRGRRAPASARQP